MGDPGTGASRNRPAPGMRGASTAKGPMAHPVLDSRDFEQARLQLERMYSAFELLPVGSQSKFHARATAAPIGKVRLVDLALGSGVRVLPAPMTHYYAIHILLDGAADVRSDADSATAVHDSMGLVLTPDATIDMRLSADCRALTVAVGRSELDEAFHAMWADLPRPGEFALGLDLRHSQVASWTQLVRWAAADLAHRDNLTAHPLLAGHIDDLILNGFIAIACRRLSPADSREWPMAPVALRRARDYIESRAAEPITVADVARVTGISVRTLQHGFRKHYGVTPTGYLREVRLHRAHRELRFAEPNGGVTVTDTALRWGFGHLPRFAAAYQQKFGQLPSETLRQALRARSL